jgi:hypothetical protein
MAYSSSATSGVDTAADKAAKFVRSMAGLVGAVFLLVGILGFIPGITQNYDTLQFAGDGSDAKLLGLFEVSILHNIVHLLFGVAGLAMAKATKSATTYLIGGGIIYLVLTVYGFLIPQDGAANFIPVNDADNWLHLLLGVGMIALGLPGRRAVDANGARTVA